MIKNIIYKVLPIVLLSIICTGLGLAAGWFAGMEKSPSVDNESSEAESHGEHSTEFSEEALQNMEVTTQEVQQTTFVKNYSIPATTKAIPTNIQPVFSPVRGYVKEVKVRFGSMVKSGDALVTIIRDPFPRVNLTLTENIVKPTTEDVHDAIGSYRRAIKNVELAQMELKRIKQYTQNTGSDKFSVVSKKTLIDAKYELERANQELSITKDELVRHGLSIKQINDIKKGERPDLDIKIWYLPLKRNGLWPPIADKIYKVLPKDIQKTHWTVVTIGELVAAGLINKALLRWLQTEPKAGQHFLEIGGLLQGGNTLEKIKSLYAIRAFDPVVVVKAPSLVKDWDCHEIEVKVGSLVEEGTTLLTLENLYELHLLVEPIGSEKNIVLKTLPQNLSMEASPLIPGVGTHLKNLTFLNIIGDDQSRMKAYMRVKNKPLHIIKHPERGQFRTWQVQEGQQYMLEIPVEKMEKVYVFPKEAVTEDGPEKIVFLQNGKSFEPIKVKVLYQDHKVVVIANNPDIFPGDSIVQTGAFALGLALKSGTEESGGHGHAH
ncbi:hypothetical protein [Candidatus Uabimicrobium sp. HlEnr_7]|uniref:hypothetical protein n=1 Tax=Candidatus Uabimicrobium helgolandensis TaxID=3095367 RepID=UPI00355829F6